MTTPISAAFAPHYVWGGACDGWHLLRSDALSVIEERMPPGTSERRHLHRHARQFFYVLAGELAVELDGVHYRLTANQGLEVAPGLAHQTFNHGALDVRFLVVSQPPSHGDRIDA